MNTPLISAEPDAGPFAVFAGTRLVAHGLLPQVVTAAKVALDNGETSSLLIFDDATGRQVEIDMRGTLDEVMRRLAPAAVPRGPGRPKMGVAAREVTLLPRHWEWLAAQPGGASAALRRLVEVARRADEGPGRRRAARDALYRFMSSMGGDQPGFEEATRALFAGDAAAFERHVAAWPTDLRGHVMRLGEAVF